MKINGRRAGKKEISALASAFNDREIRTAKGGYLFRACSDETHLHIGVVPAFIDGQRMHHYDIGLPAACTEVIIGSLNGEGVFTLLFMPSEHGGLPESERARYRSLYIELASALIEIGIRSPGELDSTTVMMLRHSGVIPDAPEYLTLQDLSCYERSNPRKS